MIDLHLSAFAPRWRFLYAVRIDAYMSGMAIAKSLNASPSGVNDFLRAFKECKSLGYPLPQGITNYGIAEAVYGKNPAIAGRDLSYEMPDYEAVLWMKRTDLQIFWSLIH